MAQVGKFLAHVDQYTFGLKISAKFELKWANYRFRKVCLGVRWALRLFSVSLILTSISKQ